MTHTKGIVKEVLFGQFFSVHLQSMEGCPRLPFHSVALKKAVQTAHSKEFNIKLQRMVQVRNRKSFFGVKIS